MPPICCSAGIIEVEIGEIESADFAGMHPATVAASTLLAGPLSSSSPVSLATIPSCKSLKWQPIAACLPSPRRLFRHWRIECNRTRGTSMHVDAILIPAATPAPPTATRPWPVPSSFSATLASSMSSSAPENSQNQSARAAATSQSGAKFDAGVNEATDEKTDKNTDEKTGANSAESGAGFVSKPDASINSKSKSNGATSHGANSDPSLNLLNLNSKTAGKCGPTPEAKPDAKSPPTPAAVPSTASSLPISVLTAAASSLFAYPLSTYLPATLLTASNPIPAPEITPSLPTSVATTNTSSLSPLLRSSSPPATPTTAAATTPAANLADPFSNRQALAGQLTANLASANLGSANLASVTAPPPLSISQHAAIPGQIITPGTPVFSGAPDAQSPQREPDPTATSATAVAVPVAGPSQAGAAPVLAVFEKWGFSASLPATSSLPASSPSTVKTEAEASPKSPEGPSVIAQAASDAATSFLSVSTQLSAAPAQFSTLRAPVSPAPTVQVSPTPAGLASLTPVSLTPVSLTPAPPTTGLPTLGSSTSTTADSSTPPAPVSLTAAVSPAPMPAGSQFHAPIPAGATIFALDQSPTVLSPSVPAASFTPALPTPATPLAKAEPSSVVTPVLTSVLNTSSEQPVALSARNQSAVPSTNSISSVVSPASSAPTPALTPAPLPVPTLQSPVNENNLAPLTEPTTAKQPAAPQSSDSKVSNSAPGNSAPVGSAPVNSVPINPSAVSSALRNISTAEPSPTSGSATPDTTPPRALSLDATSDATTAAAKSASAPETGFAVANNLTNNIATSNVSSPTPSLTTPNLTASNLTTSNLTTSNPTTSNLTSNPNTPASIAATTSDAASNAQLGVSAQPASAAALQINGADKKSSSAIQPSVTPSHDVASQGVSSQDIPAALGSGKDLSPTLNASVPPASVPPPQAATAPVPALPQTHQMLDSAPAAAAAPPPAPIAPDSPADVQMNAQINAQMHLGIRTDAFGAVEIHTVVQQSQVGITVHADQNLTRWFSSEVASLESGLNQHHLNLTAVDFDHGRSGVQTATSFQQGQPRQNFSQAPGSPSLASPEQDTASESTTTDILPSDLFAGPAQNRVSILV